MAPGIPKNRAAHRRGLSVRACAAHALLLCGVTLLAHGVRAQTMEPRSFSNSPLDLNFLITGYAYQTGNVLVDPSLPITNVKATVDTAFMAYSRTIDCWGQSGSVQLVLPYAWASASGDVFEQQRTVERSGMADLTMRVSVNLIGAPALSLEQFSSYRQDLIVGLSLRVTAPSGEYLPTKLVNIGTNRWSFNPEVGISKAFGHWTFELAPGVTFFTDNDAYLGSKVRHEDPLFAVQGHAIYNFNPQLWAALDATGYGGGRTSVNGELNDDLQRNSRWGGTFGYGLGRHNSIKLYFSSGATARSGTEFKIYGIAWQYRWGAGL
jgi:hypothetical protein